MEFKSPLAKPHLVLPSSFPILQVAEAKSLVDWMTAWREIFLDFIYSNRDNLPVNEGYVEMFLNELVCDFGAFVSECATNPFLAYRDLHARSSGLIPQRT